jgi:L-ascorbate metabolism protein UlaG (beta-lactamase superfamily)
MDITWHGHSFFEVQAGDTTVLVDPFVEENPLCDVTVEDCEADLVAVTHGDYFDHAGEADRFDAHVVCQSLMARELAQEGYGDVTDLNIGGRYEYGDATLLMTQGFHSIGTSLLDVERVDYGGVAAGYVIDDGDTRFYHSGDTCLFGDMKHVIRDVYEPDVAALPIGGHHTMEPDHAAVAADWLDVEAVVPCHYDTFEEIEQDPTEFAAMVEDATVHVLEPGDTLTA